MVINSLIEVLEVAIELFDHFHSILRNDRLNRIFSCKLRIKITNVVYVRTQRWFKRSRNLVSYYLLLSSTKRPCRYLRTTDGQSLLQVLQLCPDESCCSCPIVCWWGLCTPRSWESYASRGLGIGRGTCWSTRTLYSDSCGKMEETQRSSRRLECLHSTSQLHGGGLLQR